MSVALKRIGLVAVALIAVPAGFALFVWLGFHLAHGAGSPPFRGEGDWRWWAACAVAMAMGAWSIAALARSWVVRVVLEVVYLVGMLLILDQVTFWVDCVLRDCL